jgi:soluble lytic murein transglycosylase-like protein
MIIHFLLRVVLVCCSITLWVSAAWADDLSSAVVGRLDSRLSLSRHDMKLYQRLFENIDKADFARVSEDVKNLENPILAGDVLALEYLHPKYRPSLDELEQWLRQYADHPQVVRLYKMAESKGGDKLSVVLGIKTDRDDKLSARFLDKLPRNDRTYLVTQATKFKDNLAKGKTLAARQILENRRFRDLAPTVYWDIAASKLAMRYLVEGYYEQALVWAQKAAKRHNSGTATWVAGLAAWQLKNYRVSADYFARLAGSKNSDEWLKAGAAFWANRAYNQSRQAQKAQEMLQLAASFRYTFYGILAAYKLGVLDTNMFDVTAYSIDFSAVDYADALLQSTAVQRAWLLLKLEQTDLATQELVAVFDSLNESQKEGVILLAKQQKLHPLAITLSRKLHNDSLWQRYVSLFYPLPHWLKKSKWQADKALVLALIRQESSFQEKALSRTGARGLMQLMPNTAYYISGDETLKRQQDRLFDTDLNLSLGQKYVSYLLNKPFVDGNLFYMLSAYNAGPTNLVRWQKNVPYGQDPLLFIEIIPAAETRVYIERVMANYWMYNMRFHRENTTLEQVAKGEWPVSKVQE